MTSGTIDYRIVQQIREAQDYQMVEEKTLWRINRIIESSVLVKRRYIRTFTYFNPMDHPSAGAVRNMIETLENI